MLDFLFKPADTPVDKLDTVKDKLKEMEISKAELQDKVDQLESELTKSLVSEALSDKKAAAVSDKLSEDLKKAQLQLKAKTAAHKELTDQLPNLERSVEDYLDQQFEKKTREDAEKKLKALPTAMKKAEKAVAEAVKAIAEVAALSRPAAGAIEADIKKALRAEFPSWRGFGRITADYHYLSPQERAEFNLKDIATRGTDAILPEKSYEPTQAEKEESQRLALVAQTRAEHELNQTFQGAA